MKIFFNQKPVSGPWGGGNKLLSSLVSSLADKVTFDLTDDVDIIFCMDPRPNHQGLWYQDYLNHKTKYGSKIVQRVGDVGTHGKPQLTQLIRDSVVYSDFCIFPSQWASDYIDDQMNSIIIPNAPLDCFYEDRTRRIIPNQPVRVVTHHWSDNIRKGFDLYSEFARTNPFDVEFTYIGRYSSDYNLQGINYIPPKDKSELKSILPTYDIYLTASEEEAGANHVLEAMASGLPVLYRDSGGSIVEYCSDYGLEYDSIDSLIRQLSKCIEDYEKYKMKVLNYNERIENVIERYLGIILHGR